MNLLALSKSASQVCSSAPCKLMEGDSILPPPLLHMEFVDETSAPLCCSVKKIGQALTEDAFYLLQRIVLEKATHKQVSQEMGITIWNSQQRLTRIRKKLYEVFPERKDKKEFEK